MARLARQDGPMDATAVFAVRSSGIDTNDSSSPVSLRPRSSSRRSRPIHSGRTYSVANVTQKAIWAAHNNTTQQGRVAVFFGCQRGEEEELASTEVAGAGQSAFRSGRKKMSNKKTWRWPLARPARKVLDSGGASTRREHCEGVKPFGPSLFVRTTPTGHHCVQRARARRELQD